MERSKGIIQSQTNWMVLEAFKSTGFLVLNKTVVRKLGLIKAALLSAYVDKTIYFLKNNPENNGWFFAIIAKLKEELGITEYALTKAKKELEEMKLIRTKKKGIPAKEFIKVNTRKLEKLLYGENVTELDPQDSGGLDTKDSRGQGPQDSGGLYKETKDRKTKDRKTKDRKNNFLDNWKKSMKLLPIDWREDPGLQKLLFEFEKNRKEIHKSLTSLARTKIIKKLIKHDLTTAKRALTQSIENSWTGVYPESIDNNKSRRGRNAQGISNEHNYAAQEMSAVTMQKPKPWGAPINLRKE